MQTFFLQGFKKNSTNPIYFPCAYNIEILSFYFSYGYLCDDYNGYAHLLEHMIIKIRQKYFDKVYENGILFNAVTKEYTTEYTFINLRGGNYLEKNQFSIEKFFENIQINEIQNELLETEKRIILEEFSILENRFERVTVEQMLGSKRDIENFSIKKMYDMYCVHYVDKKSMIIVKQNHINDRFYKIPKKMTYNKKNLVIQYKKDCIMLKKTQGANVVLYFLHICSITQLGKRWEIDIQDDCNYVKIKISGELYIDKKQHIINRYWLMCSNLKVYMDEISYLINNNLLYLDIYGGFMDNWEGSLYD